MSRHLVQKCAKCGEDHHEGACLRVTRGGSFAAPSGSAKFVWQCKCGWIVDEVRYLSIVFDAPCFLCKAKYSTFKRRQWQLSPNRELSHGDQKEAQ